MNNIEQLVSVGIAGLGVIMLLVGLFWFLASIRFKSRARVTTGTITGFMQRRSSSSSGPRTVTYAPMVRFQTADGRQVDFVSTVSSSSSSMKEGDSVEVLYLESNPKKAKIKGFAGSWLGPLVMLFVGAVLISVGVVIWFFIGG